jgi:Fe-Mn family superoxide dismutase
MEKQKLYVLPDLPYEYNALEPHISEDLLKFHHDKHHASYVKGANEVLEMMDNTRKDKMEFEAKSIFKELSFHVGGHMMHSLFWENMASPNKNGGGNPSGKIEDVLKEEFGTIDRFKKLFSQVAFSVEGGGWAALTYCKHTQRPIIMQVEKHNNNVFPQFRILMVLDVWEHAYYLDYKNERKKYIESFWNVINWEEINNRLEKIL